MRRGSECELSSEVELRPGRERVRVKLRGKIARQVACSPQLSVLCYLECMLIRLRKAV